MGCPSRCDQFTTSTRYSFNRGLCKFVFLKLYDIEICWENIMHSCLILLRWRPNLVRILRTQWTTTKFDFKHFLSNLVSCKSPWWYRLATFADFPSEPCMSSRRTAVEAWDRLHAWFIFFFFCWIANVFQTFVCDYCFVVLPTWFSVNNWVENVN